MKRFLSILTALCLMCSLALPALAAGTPNWDGPLGEGAGPHLCKTGKDYVLYYDMSGSVYRSADGVTWTELNRQWTEESTPYSTGLNGLAKKEFEILWTGSEYMMRESLLDDPRTTTHQQYGDSPRNNMVTFLDEEFRIVGVRAFDAPVTAIGYENGVYSAVVNGEKVTFSRADWDLGQGLGDNYAVGDHGVLRKVEVDDPNGGSIIARFDYSMDGYSWVTVENTPWTTSPEMVRILPSSGKDFFVCNTYSGEIYTSSDGFTWTTHTPVTGTWHSIEGVASPMRADYIFRWAGSGYLVCQNVFGTGGMYGAGGDTRGPRNNVLTFVDESWNEVWSHDFGARVLDAGFQNDTWYALVQDGDSTAVWSSSDKEHWERTDRTALPAMTEADGLQFAIRENRLLASDDGAYWVDLGEYTVPEGTTFTVRSIFQQNVRGDGAMLNYVFPVGAVLENVESDGSARYGRVVDTAEVQGLLRERFGISYERYYVTLDGEKLSFDTAPIARNDRILVPLRGIAEALDFTVTWDQASNRVLCERGETRIALEIDSPNAWVNDEERVQDVAPLAYQNRTYVPLRFLSEAFGLDVQWNAEERTAVLTTADA